MTDTSTSPRSENDLPQIPREHYLVARSLTATFDISLFVAKYRTLFSTRDPASIVPGDYCVNQFNARNASFPRFLVLNDDGTYTFVGLDLHGDGSGSTPAIPSSAPPPTTGADFSDESTTVAVRPYRQKTVVVRIRRNPSRSVALCREPALRALAAFNGNESQKVRLLRARAMLPRGLDRQRVQPQIIALSQVWKENVDPAGPGAMATALQEHWTRFRLVVDCRRPLLEELPPASAIVDSLELLFAHRPPFTHWPLATMILNAAQPQIFAPCDRSSLTTLPAALGIAFDRDPDACDLPSLSVLYRDYLEILRDIALANGPLLQEMRGADVAATGIGSDRLNTAPTILWKVIRGIAMQPAGAPLGLFALPGTGGA